MYISGMPAPGADGTFVAGTFDEEADLAWANVTAIAAAGGYSADDCLYVQVLPGDIGSYGAIATGGAGGSRTPPGHRPG
jgi:enamine deaminase RidA (YjgF/YER057c/UK114 family)